MCEVSSKKVLILCKVEILLMDHILSLGGIIQTLWCVRGTKTASAAVLHNSMKNHFEQLIVVGKGCRLKLDPLIFFKGIFLELV